MNTIELPTTDEPIALAEGDCLSVLPELPDGCVDAVVTDPPYGLGFMGKKWDTPGALVEREADRSVTWDKVGGNHNPSNGVDQARTRCAESRRFGEWCDAWVPLLRRVLKPGGYLLAMGGTRTYHRLACAIEDAGLEVRDCLMWVYGTGFPKGHGCLKPAWEPILLARNPGPKVLPLGIDGCRVPTTDTIPMPTDSAIVVGGNGGTGYDRPWKSDPDALDRRRAAAAVAIEKANTLGRYPANLLHDGSDEVLEAFAAFGETSGNNWRKSKGRGMGYHGDDKDRGAAGHDDTGTAARFFYCAKASKSERGPGNSHPTVKPLELMKWLVRLVCPPGGLVLDPFAGSGTTGLATYAEGRRAVLIERQPEYCETIRTRVAAA